MYSDFLIFDKFKKPFLFYAEWLLLKSKQVQEYDFPNAVELQNYLYSSNQAFFGSSYLLQPKITVRKIYLYVKEVIEIQRTNIMPVPVESEVMKTKVLKKKKKNKEKHPFLKYYVRSLIKFKIYFRNVMSKGLQRIKSKVGEPPVKIYIKLSDRNEKQSEEGISRISHCLKDGNNRSFRA